MNNTNEPYVDPPAELKTNYSPAKVPVYILCGGQSARFGTDKARVRIDEQPHLLRLAKTLRSHGHEVHFVADCQDRYEDLGIIAIVDAQPHCGPLAGLVSAAKHRSSHYSSGWFLLLSCDQLCWKPKYFQWLADCAREDLAAITYCDPFIQPIPGLYHTQIHSSAFAALEQRQLSLKKLLEQLGRSAQSIERSDNPRKWCFNEISELHSLLDKLSLEHETKRANG